ncbi:MAG: hypothetical protein ABII71_04335 [Candidatus Micrarchaeota archaeon]
MKFLETPLIALLIMSPQLLFSLLIVIFAVLYYGVLSKKERLGYWIGLCTWREKLPLVGMHINENYELLPGEKIVIPRTLCMASNTLPVLSFLWRPMGFMVTNKRIMMALRLDLLIYTRETFGRSNYWKSDVKEMPEHRFPLRSNFRIDNIQYGEDEGVPFMEIAPAVVETNMAGFLKTEVPPSHGKLFGRLAKIRVYHPQAKKISELFGKTKKQ